MSGTYASRDFTATSSLRGSRPNTRAVPASGRSKLSRHLIVVVLDRKKRARGGHMREPRFHGDFIFARVEAEHARRAGIGPEQIKQALDRRGFARAVAAEKAVAFAGAHVQREAVHGIQLAVTAVEVVDFNDVRVSVHVVLPVDTSFWRRAVPRLRKQQGEFRTAES